jgi:hypothetical protein
VLSVLVAALESLRSLVRTHRELAPLTVPTATFLILYVFLALSVERGRVVHWNVTSAATAEWTAQPIVDAFPEDTARATSCATATASTGPRSAIRFLLTAPPRPNIIAASLSNSYVKRHPPGWPFSRHWRSEPKLNGARPAAEGLAPVLEAATVSRRLRV